MVVDIWQGLLNTKRDWLTNPVWEKWLAYKPGGQPFSLDKWQLFSWLQVNNEMLIYLVIIIIIHQYSFNDKNVNIEEGSEAVNSQYYLPYQLPFCRYLRSALQCIDWRLVYILR